MRTLRDIKCDINKTSLIGKIVVQDDNKYEGIVVDIKSKRKFLVMGVISNNNLELIALHKKSKDPVYFIDSEKNDSKFIGEVYSIKDNKKTLICTSSIALLDPFYYRDVNEGEIISVLAKTRILKAEISEYNKENKPKVYTKSKNKVHK